MWQALGIQTWKDQMTSSHGASTSSAEMKEKQFNHQTKEQIISIQRSLSIASAWWCLEVGAMFHISLSLKPSLDKWMFWLECWNKIVLVITWGKSKLGVFQNLPEDHWIENTGNERKRNKRGSRDGHGPVHTGPRKKGEKLQYYSKCYGKSLHNKMQSVSPSKTPPSSHSATNHRAKLDLPELLLGLSHSSHSSSKGKAILLFRNRGEMGPYSFF